VAGRAGLREDSDPKDTRYLSDVRLGNARVLPPVEVASRGKPPGCSVNPGIATIAFGDFAAGSEQSTECYA
jgi:hypothetical protein